MAAGIGGKIRSACKERVYDACAFWNALLCAFLSALNHHHIRVSWEENNSSGGSKYGQLGFEVI